MRRRPAEPRNGESRGRAGAGPSGSAGGGSGRRLAAGSGSGSARVPTCPPRFPEGSFRAGLLGPTRQPGGGQTHGPGGGGGVGGGAPPQVGWASRCGAHNASLSGASCSLWSGRAASDSASEGVTWPGGQRGPGDPCSRRQAGPRAALRGGQVGELLQSVALKLSARSSKQSHFAVTLQLG